VTVTEVEIRCPVGSMRLLAKVLRSGEACVNEELNLIEFACHDCLRAQKRRAPGREVSRVLHRYNVAGQLVETVTRP
jgi:hypothetical protein